MIDVTVFSISLSFHFVLFLVFWHRTFGRYGERSDGADEEKNPVVQNTKADELPPLRNEPINAGSRVSGRSPTTGRHTRKPGHRSTTAYS